MGYTAGLELGTLSMRLWNSLIVYDNLWALRFDNFYEFQSVISELRTEIDMRLTPNNKLYVQKVVI